MVVSIIASSKLHLQGAMLSEPGQARATNEDHVTYVIPNSHDPRAGKGELALIADGMGGHAAGEVASGIAVDVIAKTYYETGGSADEALRTAFREANAAIFAAAGERAELEGMGTTCTAVAIRDGRAWLAHVGDSRCYLLRGGELRQLSEDHSLVNGLVRAGVITSEEAHTRSDRNVILRALGTRPEVEVAVWGEGRPLSDGDVLLLCSDGLSDYVDDRSITSILLTEPHELEACRALIAAALAAGSDDDISVGVFTLNAESPSASRAIGDTRTRRVS